MISFIPSRDKNTVAVVFEGKSTADDVVNLDHYVEEHFNKDEKLNMFAIIEEIDGTTFKGITDGIKFDIAHWKRYNKFAVISEEKWLKKYTKMIGYLPGITTRFFTENQIDRAWDWIKA